MASKHGVMQRFLGKVKTKLLLVSASGFFILAGAAGPVLSPNVWGHAGVPVNGGSGTYAGFAAKGDILVDTTNATFYQNTNTLSSPTWTQITTASGAGTYTGTFDGVIGGNTPAAGAFTAVTSSGINTASVGTGITASVTQTRIGGTALTKQYNVVSTVALAGNAVTLAALAPGQSQIIFNKGANAASVFPNGASDTIDGGAGGAAVTLTNALRCLYVCIAANTIISAQLGAVSA